MKEDDLFAPRPKFSLNQRLIRGIAICFGCCVGLSCFFLYAIAAYILIANQPIFLAPGWTSNRAALLSAALEAVITETLILVVLWRCYELRRWACRVLLFIASSAILCLYFLLFSGEALAFAPLLVALFVLYIFHEEWPNLKAGF